MRLVKSRCKWGWCARECGDEMLAHCRGKLSLSVVSGCTEQHPGEDSVFSPPHTPTYSDLSPCQPGRVAFEHETRRTPPPQPC